MWFEVPLRFEPEGLGDVIWNQGSMGLHGKVQCSLDMLTTRCLVGNAVDGTPV